jgi:hypothetical protein
MLDAQIERWNARKRRRARLASPVSTGGDETGRGILALRDRLRTSRAARRRSRANQPRKMQRLRA